MKKEFCVYVDITMAQRIYVDAESEEQAKMIAASKIDENPYAYTKGFSHYVGYEIIDVTEE